MRPLFHYMNEEQGRDGRHYPEGGFLVMMEGKESFHWQGCIGWTLIARGWYVS